MYKKPEVLCIPIRIKCNLAFAFAFAVAIDLPSAWDAAVCVLQKMD